MNLQGKRVLIFGDSLSHYGSDSGPEVHDYTGPVTSSAPGAVLASKLLGRGASAARTDARVSRSAVNFWSREDYGKLLAGDVAWRPDLVIVMLGTNDLHLNPKTDAQAMAGIRDAFRQTGAEVIAIGPPVLPESSEHVYLTLAQVFGKVIDGRLLSVDVPRARDGVHFTASGAEQYAERLAHELARPSPMIVQTASTAGLSVAVMLIGVLIGRRF